MTKYRFMLIDTSIPGDVERFEELKTSALDDDAIQIILQETSFTKDGNYLIALHWVEHSATTEDRETLRQMVEDRI